MLWNVKIICCIFRAGQKGSNFEVFVEMSEIEVLVIRLAEKILKLLNEFEIKRFNS
jgi:hypothetical protein